MEGIEVETVTFQMIVEAARNFRNIIKETDFCYSESLSDLTGGEVYLKLENLQQSGSFKIRGAYNKMIHLSDEEKACGVVASSAGNHAQGVAISATKLGIKSTIVMPKSAPFAKIYATRKYGGEVVLEGEVYDEAYQKALEIKEATGATFVHPFNDPYVIAGQGTIGLELLKEQPDLDVILVPIGGGGLISGIACAAKQIKPTIKIIGVEPEGAASALAAINEDQVVALKEANTIADGTAVKEIGDMTFDYIKEYVDGTITVSDYELMDAFLLLVEKHKLVAENSGILSLAALKKLNEKNKKVVSLISGGNIDVLTISSMINKGLIARGRVFTFTVQLLDKPGELEYVSHVLAQCNANVIGVEHNQFKNFARFSEVELRVTCETNGEKHIQKIMDTFAKEGYEITRIN